MIIDDEHLYNYVMYGMFVRLCCHQQIFKIDFIRFQVWTTKSQKNANFINIPHFNFSILFHFPNTCIRLKWIFNTHWNISVEEGFDRFLIKIFRNSEETRSGWNKTTTDAIQYENDTVSPISFALQFSMVIIISCTVQTESYCVHKASVSLQTKILN